MLAEIQRMRRHSATWCKDDAVPQSREEFESVKEFVDEVFVEIDRPGDHLATIEVEIEGDSSAGISCTFALGLTREQQRALVRHAASELTTYADSSWRDREGPVPRVDRYLPKKASDPPPE